MDPITLTMTTDECQLVVEALADRPFRQTVGLIQKIQTQVQPQLEKKDVVQSEVQPEA